MNIRDEVIRVVVCGYPKSGTSWLTRLTADLLGCEVLGMWGKKIREEPELEKNSIFFECYKSHLPANYFQNAKINHIYPDKIIYIVRDPRDVIISAAHYFNVSPFYLRWKDALKKYRLRRIFSFFFNRTDYQTALEIVTEGGDIVNMNIPWDVHVQGFADEGHLIVHYEELLSNPLNELGKIQNFIGIKHDSQHMKAVVKKNSFHEMKSKYIREKNKKKIRFLRKGEAGQWRTRLSRDQVQKIHQTLGKTLAEQGYSIN